MLGWPVARTGHPNIYYRTNLFNRKGQLDIRKGPTSLQALEFTGGDNRDRTDDLLHAMQTDTL